MASPFGILGLQSNENTANDMDTPPLYADELMDQATVMWNRMTPRERYDRVMKHIPTEIKRSGNDKYTRACIRYIANNLI